MDTVPVFQQRRVWVALLDAVVALIGLVATQFVTPDMAKFIIAVVGVVQVPAVTLIIAFTKDNTELNRAGYVRTSEGIQPFPVIHPDKQ